MQHLSGPMPPRVIAMSPCTAVALSNSRSPADDWMSCNYILSCACYEADVGSSIVPSQDIPGLAQLRVVEGNGVTHIQYRVQ